MIFSVLCLVIWLIESGASIKRALGNNGYVGRFSADQFLAYSYLENTDEETVLRECRLIRNSITNASQSNVSKSKITATMGAVIVPDQAKDFDDILLKANRALTRGKAKGRDCFVIYSEKCEDKIYDNPIIPSETLEATTVTNEGKIVAGVFELMNHGSDIERNIYESFNIIATYFQLDRIAIYYNASSDNPYDEGGTYIEWTNPFYPNLKGLVKKDYDKQKKSTLKNEFKKVLNLGTFKINQIESNKKLKYVYDRLKETHTEAIFMNELTYMGKNFGIIRYENCNINRFWTITDTSPLHIITKIISMAIYNKLEKELLENLVYRDRLTGLYNYSNWKINVENFIATTNRYPNYAIASLNILAFSKIISKYGANVGDSILRTIAEALNIDSFEGKISCRVSDDKFLLFIANKSKPEVEQIIKDIQNFVYSRYNQIRINILVGVDYHKDLETINDCLDYSNLALKNATIMNRIVFFDNEISLKEKHKSIIELHMREALQNKEFLLYLQPKVNTTTNEVVGAEALTRWNFNFEKLLFPNDFIPIFEENGFINDLDYGVFENVCSFLRQIIDLGYKPIKISVNVSRYQKDFTKYLNTLNEIRNKYNIEAKYIEIEITESMYNENVEDIANFINDLHKNGYYVSMDDFGSGYSNLASLAKLDFDIIKLDKTFCNDLNNYKEQTILAFVMNLVKDLDIDVLCEGVETKELIENLKNLGCFLVQGYYYSKPIPSEEFIEKFLKKN